MMIKMVLRNVFRHKRRTLITVITIAVGIMFYVAMDSLLVGTDRMLIESMVKFSDGSIIIYSKEYDENRRGFPLDKGVKDYDRIVEIVKGQKDISGITYRVRFLGEMIFGAKSKYIVGTVIDNYTDSEVFEISNYVKGRYLSSNEGEVIVGSALAKKLGVGVGDYVVISVKTVNGAYNAMEFEIVGIIESPDSVLNESGVIISYSSARSLLGIKDLKTSVHLKVNWPRGESVMSYLDRLDKITANLREQLGEYSVYSLRDLYKDFLLLMEQKRVSSFLIVFIILVIAGVGIANSILMSVYERVKEIGVLMAMGMKPKEVRKIFLLEGITLGVLGAVGGIFLGVIVDLFLIYVGYDITVFASSGTELGIPVWGVIYGEWNFIAFVEGFLFALVVSAVSSYFPARYASKLKVTECLKFV